MPAQVAGAVVVRVEEAADVDLVEDGALEPQRVGLEPLARPLVGRSLVALGAIGVRRVIAATGLRGRYRFTRTMWLARAEADEVAADAATRTARR